MANMVNTPAGEDTASDVIGGTCTTCGLPGHRYGSTDPEHEPSPWGCINSLRGKLDDAEAHYEQIGLLIDGVEFIPMDIVRAHMPFATPPGTDCVAVYARNYPNGVEF